MSPLVRTEDLIDSRDVAVIIGLSHLEAVSLYQRRYPDMPRPVVNLGPNRSRLWLRPEIEAWAKKRKRVARGQTSAAQPAALKSRRGASSAK